MAKIYTNRYGELYQKVTLNLSAKAMDYVRVAAKDGFRSISAEVEMILQERMLGEGRTNTSVELPELIDRVPWRATSYGGDSWPSEAVVWPRYDQRELVESIFRRFRAGEGVATRFFRTTTTCLFIGDYKYWLMSDSKPVDVDAMEKSNLFDVDALWSGWDVHRARLYRDQPDFMVRDGDSPRDYQLQPLEDPLDGPDA